MKDFLIGPDGALTVPAAVFVTLVIVFMASVLVYAIYGITAHFVHAYRARRAAALEACMSRHPAGRYRHTSQSSFPNAS